jgi:hypothetical protein
MKSARTAYPYRKAKNDLLVTVTFDLKFGVVRGKNLNKKRIGFSKIFPSHRII